MQTQRIAEPAIVRLWTIGGTNNVVRMMELLAAALFTLQVTGSGTAVAVVTAARSMPLLLFGAMVGVIADAVNRKYVLLGVMLVATLASLSICLLAGFGVLRPWHVALAAFANGTVWTSDQSVRRRMLGEVAHPNMLLRVIAWDSLANSVTRTAGPLLGSVGVALLGTAGTYACSTAVGVLGIALLLPIRHPQVPRPLSLLRGFRDLAEAVAAARGARMVLLILGVTVVVNMFGYAYTGMVAPLGLLVFHVPDSAVGLLAASEPLGALIGGLVLANTVTAVLPRGIFVTGSTVFLVMLALLPVAPSYAVACLMLVVGGMGTSLFSNLQTTLILTSAPQGMRSRMMGLTTACIGSSPIGLLAIGALNAQYGALAAVEIMAITGLVLLGAVAATWLR